MAENAQSHISNGVCMASSHLCQLECFRTAFINFFLGKSLVSMWACFPWQLFCSSKLKPQMVNGTSKGYLIRANYIYLQCVVTCSGFFTFLGCVYVFSQ